MYNLQQKHLKSNCLRIYKTKSTPGQGSFINTIKFLLKMMLFKLCEYFKMSKEKMMTRKKWKKTHERTKNMKELCIHSSNNCTHRAASNNNIHTQNAFSTLSSNKLRTFYTKEVHTYIYRVEH